MPQHELEQRLIELAHRDLIDDDDAFAAPDTWQLTDFEDMLPMRR